MAFEVKIPRVGESIQEVTIAKWLKADGDRVEVDESLCEVESDKTSFELPSERAGILKRVAQEGATLTIGAVVAQIEEGASEAPPERAAVAPPAEVPKVEKPAEKPPEPPQVAERVPTAVAPIENRKSTIENSPDRTMRREKMTTLRKTISKRLVAAKNETAMLTTFNEVDMSAIMAIRAKYGETFKKKYGVKPGFVSFFVLFACEAIKSWPAINAKIEGDEIVYQNYCDVGIAVSTDRGLVVPPIRNADRMTIVDLEREISRLAEIARTNKLTIDDLTGGTFTITNGGVFGSMLSTPIINAPQSAILGMHNIVERAVVVDGEIVVRPIMYVALSYDHRIIDGKEAVGFLVSVRQLLEEPARILLSL